MLDLTLGLDVDSMKNSEEESSRFVDMAVRGGRYFEPAGGTPTMTAASVDNPPSIRTRTQLSWQENIFIAAQHASFRLFSVRQTPVFPLFAERQDEKVQEFIIFRIRVRRNTDNDIGLFHV
jgi:hypothetical protein